MKEMVIKWRFALGIPCKLVDVVTIHTKFNFYYPQHCSSTVSVTIYVHMWNYTTTLEMPIKLTTVSFTTPNNENKLSFSNR